MTDSLDRLADELRREHLALHGISDPVPWGSLQRYEQGMWRDRAAAKARARERFAAGDPVYVAMHPDHGDAFCVPGRVVDDKGEQVLVSYRHPDTDGLLLGLVEPARLTERVLP